MLKIEQWCPDKPYLIRIFAQDTLRSAQTYYETLSFARHSNIPDEFDPPDFNEWVSYYENESFIEDITETFMNQTVGCSAIFNTLKAFQGEEVHIPEHLQGLSDDEVYAAHINDIKDDIVDRSLTDEEKKFASEHVLTTRFLFLWRVSNPCQILYDAHPHVKYSS